ncbi:MAG: LLM class F420-dependent oxidoreductase [Chloroflexi bacterium]|nr:LLM class F420-dependent oxidoreductase [Chloroflexota bacterium]
MTQIRIGVQVRPQHSTYEAYRQAWLQLDDMGVDIIMTWDHFFPLWGDSNGPHFESWTLQAALGAQTKHAIVSCLVMSMSYRNPALLSGMARTLDHIMGGRFILGLGAGWFKRDYDEFDYDFGTPGERLRTLERGIEILEARWKKDVPPPVNGTIPILIGGGGEKVTLRIAAQHADIWHAAGAPADWSRKNEILNDWCQKVGREPSAIRRACAARPEHFDALDDYVTAGATDLIYGWDAPWDTSQIEQLLAWRDRANASR